MAYAYGSSTAIPNDPLVVITNAPHSSQDGRYDYPHKLLELALNATQETDGPFVLQFAEEPLTRTRALLEMESGHSLQVMTEAVKPDWHAKLIEIPIPIRRGVQGLRKLMVRTEVKDTVEKIVSLDQLKQFTTGSGVQWSTRKVLEDEGFQVVVSSDYASLFRMLSNGRFDTFARGINEIEPEFQEFSKIYSNIAIIDNIGLYQILPTYFYVSPKFPTLADRIARGLAILQENGTFDTVFCQYNQESLAQVKTTDRYFCLKNGNLAGMPILDETKYIFGLCESGILDLTKITAAQLCQNP